jgi:hypothetical protein
MENKVRVRAVISGRVQGVFFRLETKKAAECFPGASMDRPLQKSLMWM